MTHPTDALRLVPVEPTIPMLNAGWAKVREQGFDVEDVELDPIWNAMLAAAPASPLPGGGPYENVPVKRKLEAGAALRDRLKAAGDGLGSQVVADLLASLRASHQNSAALFAELKEARGLLSDLMVWFEKYPEFKPNPVYMSGVTRDIDKTRAFLARNGKGEGQ